MNFVVHRVNKSISHLYMCYMDMILSFSCFIQSTVIDKMYTITREWLMCIHYYIIMDMLSYEHISFNVMINIQTILNFLFCTVIQMDEL